MNLGDDRHSGCIDLMKYQVDKSTRMIHRDNRALASYWEELRSGRPCPYRAEVDPRDITSKISNLFILEDLGQGNVRFRLAGTALTDAFGMELRGMHVRSMMDPSARLSFAELIRETLAEPGVGYARLRRAGGRRELWELVLLPLRSDKGQVDRLIGSLHALDPAGSTPAEPPLSFEIEEMEISPVKISSSQMSKGAALAGFAEPPANYEPPDYTAALAAPIRPILHAIEGGKRRLPANRPDEGCADTPRRPFLRVVSED